jgi:hypothetical protein
MQPSETLLMGDATFGAAGFITPRGGTFDILGRRIRPGDDTSSVRFITTRFFGNQPETTQFDIASVWIAPAFDFETLTIGFAGKD